MTVLVSGYGDRDTGGGLFAVSGSAAERIDRVSTMGLASSGGVLARALRAGREAERAGELLLYDQRGIRSYHRIDELRDPHSLVFDGDLLIVASTGTNELLWLSPAGTVVRRLPLPGQGDAWHLNGVFRVHGRLLASAFGRFGSHRGWKGRLRDREGVLFELGDHGEGANLITQLDAPHQALATGAGIVLCNSARHEVLLLDPATWRVLARAELGGWTRGVAETDRGLLVGESSVRGSEEKEGGGTASLALLDPVDLRVIERIPLPCSQVYDVLPVEPELVAGVRTGFRTNGQRTAEDDQLALFRAAGVDPPRLWSTGDPLPASACRARLEGELPEALEPREAVEVELRVQNTGAAILTSSPPNPVHLSCRWLDSAGGAVVQEGLRSPLPHSLPPGEATTVTASVTAPWAEGNYELAMTLVQEEVAWFDDLDPGSGIRGGVRVAGTPTGAASKVALVDRPPLSVIVATRDPWPHAQVIVDSLVEQVEAVGGELIVADGSGRGLPRHNGYGAVRLFERRGVSVFELRAMALLEARGKIVAIAEDHCAAPEGWCRQVLDAHERHPEAPAIGGVVSNGATRNLFDWAAFILTFSEFIGPVSDERERVPPLCTMSYKRSTIPVHASEPGYAEFVLNPALDREGKITIDERVRIVHAHSLKLAGHVRKHFHNGRATGGSLAQGRSWRARGSLLRGYLDRPLVLHRSTMRAVAPHRAGLPRRARLALPLVPVLCSAHAAGEVVGIATGRGKSLDIVD